MAKATIVWFRQDLRIEDNPALTAAFKNGGPVYPVFIWSPEEEKEWPQGAASLWWLHHSLKNLEDELRTLKLGLLIRRSKSLNALRQLAEEVKAEAVYWNRRYEPASIERDASVKASLKDDGIDAKSFNGSLLFEPWEVMNKQNKPYQVFTPFWKACLAKETPIPPLPKPPIGSGQPKRISSLTIGDLGLKPKIPWDAGIAKAWKPGSKEAKRILGEFVGSPILRYQEQRDRPDLQGVSRLSPYLHFGEISPRMAWHAVLNRCDKNEKGVECYLRQLGWREFAYHLLYHFPHTPLEPLKEDFKNFAWNRNPIALKAWKKGMTGYPLIDAGMRELWTTGWMHNRVRMAVGSFLVKDLLIHWLEGARWFWDTLVDADLANNTLGWQWVGGCGADAAPYFRVFNPVLQGEKFDPEGVYVRRWVPELKGLPNKWIHKPFEAPLDILRQAKVELGSTYPLPIVNHQEAKKKALEAYHLLAN